MSGFKDKEAEGRRRRPRRGQGRGLQAAAGGDHRDVDGHGGAPPIDLDARRHGRNISNDVKEALPTISRSLTDIVRINPMFSRPGIGRGRSGAGDLGRGHAASATTTCRSTARSTTTCSGWRARPARRAAPPRRSRSASTRSRRCSSSSRRTTCGRAASRAAASTPSPRAARTTSTARRSSSAATRTGSARASPTRRSRPSRTSRAASASAGRSCRTRRSSSGRSTTQRKQRPTGFSVGGTGSQLRQRGAVDRFLERSCRPCTATTRGRIRRASSSRTTNSDKFFVRADFNVATGHQLTVRHNYVDALERHRHAVDDGVSDAGLRSTGSHQHDELDGRPAELARSARASTSCA